MKPTPEELMRDYDKKRAKRDKLAKESKEALLGAAAVISLGMLIKKVLE